MATKFPIGNIHGYSMVSKNCYCLLILLITANLISQMQASPGNRKESWALIKEHVSNHYHVTLVTCQDEIFWVADLLTHWGRVTQICLSKFTIIGSDNGLSPIRRQAIIWTNAGILLTNFSEILIQIHTFSNKKMRLKMSSGKWRPFCLGLNVLNLVTIWTHFEAFYDFCRIVKHSNQTLIVAGSKLDYSCNKKLTNDWFLYGYFASISRKRLLLSR